MIIQVTVFHAHSHNIKVSYQMDYNNVYHRARLGESSRDALMAGEAILTQHVGG